MSIPSLRISTASGCNHRCTGCQFGGDYAVRNQSLLTSDSAWRIIEGSIHKFHKAGVRHFSLTGGEPLTNPVVTFRAAELIRELIADEGYLRINSNGVLVPKHIRKMSMFDLVKISLLGLDEETYQENTGSKNAKRDLSATLKGLDMLCEHDIPVRLQVIVYPNTKDRLWEWVSLAEQYPCVKALKFFDLSEYSELWREDGRDSADVHDENYVSLRLFEQELLKVSAVLQGNSFSIGGYGNPMPTYRYNGLEIRLRTSDEVAFYSSHCNSCIAKPFCRDGHCNLEVGPNGLIKVCRPMEGVFFRPGEESDAVGLFQNTDQEKVPPFRAR
ncbi:radical SAM protein [Candidatus Pacebacteria bacterium]|nr:radical SAM protein [Candidatus Paceibacterota bacterium]